MHRFALLIILAWTARVCPAQVTIDFESATAVLTSMQDAKLTLDAARQVCELPGNQGLVHKENSYGRKATTQSCASALLAAAQDRTPDPAFRFNFGAFKPRAAALIALLDQIRANPSTFDQWITTRVQMYSPAKPGVKIVGYLVTGGPSGGFAFGQPEFYLNLAYPSFNAFDVVRVIMAHELYHAVQGVYATKKAWWSQDDADRGPDVRRAKQCATTDGLLRALYEEGTASYVGDVLLLHDAKDAGAKKLVAEMQQGLSHIGDSITLLELSITGLNAADPVPFDSVYAIGFYAPAEIEYKLGYVMAAAIVADRGNEALTALLSQPSYAFVDVYSKLPRYGKDNDHLKLGPNTLAAVERLQNGCPSPAGR